MSNIIIDAPLIKNETPFNLSSHNLGEYLKHIRETLNISAQEVAKQLRLNINLIIAIESDDYSQAPEPIFIRGYLRAYARLLNISEDMIIELYNQKQVEETMSEKKSHRVSVHEFLRPQKSIHHENQPKWFISVIFLLLGLGMTSIWWLNHHAKNFDYSTSLLIEKSESTLREIFNIQSWMTAGQSHSTDAIPLKKKSLVTPTNTQS